MGSETVTATYTGDGSFATSSGTTTETVSIRPTTTNASANPTTSKSGTSVTYSANVAPTSGSGVPTRSVTFTVGSTTLCVTSP